MGTMIGRRKSKVKREGKKGVGCQVLGVGGGRRREKAGREEGMALVLGTSFSIAGKMIEHPDRSCPIILPAIILPCSASTKERCLGCARHDKRVLSVPGDESELPPVD